MPNEAKEHYMQKTYERESLIKMEGANGVSFNPLAEESSVVLKGHLLKKNKYGIRQKRFFELYQYGELKYYKDREKESYDYKGSITVTKDSTVKRVERGSLKITCQTKKNEYTLL